MDGASCTGMSTLENTQCDTSPTLPSRRGAKRTPLRENVLGNNSSIVVPRARRKLSTYFGPPCTDLIRDSGETAKEKWSNEEIKALVEFILLHMMGDNWPSHRQDVFWRNAGAFVQDRAGSSLCRSGK